MLDGGGTGLGYPCILNAENLPLCPPWVPKATPLSPPNKTLDCSDMNTYIRYRERGHIGTSPENRITSYRSSALSARQAKIL
jgi:hypothetical protein